MDYICTCSPGRIRHALAELPETLDGTYERTLREINKANWRLAHRLFQCVAVASRPLRFDELAEFLSFGYEAELLPKSHEGWRRAGPVDAVLSTCSSLLSVVHVEDSPVIQFSHFSVKKFFTSIRLAETGDDVSRCYHVSTTSAHTLVTQACLGSLLHLYKAITRDTLQKFPLVEYAAKYWVDHARDKNVSQSVEDSMKQLFEPRRPHLALWVWIHDPVSPSCINTEQADRPSPLEGTALHYAAVCGLDAVVHFLVTEHSQDVHSRGFKTESTPLHLASQRGHVEVARVLLYHGADVTAQNGSGWTPLHEASAEGHMEVVRILLGHKAAQDLSTPLHLASERGFTDIAHVLLEHNTDPNARNLDNSTPLHRASQDGHLGVSLVLLEHNADVNSLDENDMTPLHLASRLGRLDVVENLLEFDADWNAMDESNWTPLHFASQEGHLEIVELLLNPHKDPNVEDEDPNVENEDQQTPLFLSSRSGQLEVAQILLKHGADANRRDWLSRSPLHVASENGHHDITRLLLDRGAKVNAEDAHLWTPLHMASKKGKLTAVQVLLNRGANVEALNDLRRTPLHMAAQEGHWEVVWLLLTHGANVDTQEADGETALHLAAYYGHPQVAKLLLRYRANIHAWNKERETPCDLASKEGHHDVMQVLATQARGEGSDSVVAISGGWISKTTQLTYAILKLLNE